MKTTDKQGCNIIVTLLAEHGVKRVVLSPGSRNAPLLMAFSRTPDIQDYVVVDERTAAFMALGMMLPGMAAGWLQVNRWHWFVHREQRYSIMRRLLPRPITNIFR